MKSLTALLVTLLLAVSIAATAAQETPTATPEPESPFQVVRVDNLEFQVDPYFPCVIYLTQRTSRLGEGGVTTILTLQPFYRSGDQMIAGDAYPSYENDLTATVEVGGAFTCVPQVEFVEGGDG